MSSHSISKINMAAFKRKLDQRICVEIFLSILNLFCECTILLFCLEVAVSIHTVHVFQISHTGHSSKTFFRLIDRCVPKDTSCQLFCILENFYTSGMQDAGVTESLHFCLWLGNEHGWQLIMMIMMMSIMMSMSMNESVNSVIYWKAKYDDEEKYYPVIKERLHG